MQVPRETARETQPEFKFADAYLKSLITKVATNIQNSDVVKSEDKRLAHWEMVAQVTKMYLDVLSFLDPELLEELKEMKGNVLSINKFLALRQLTEQQLKGVMEGTWGLGAEQVNTDLFRQSVATSINVVTKENVHDKIKSLSCDVDIDTDKSN